MFNDLANLKIFDPKFYWKESLAELYKILIAESEMTEKRRIEISRWFEQQADSHHDEDSDKLAIDNIIRYWSAFFMYTSRVNFLKNSVSNSKNVGIFKGKEMKEFAKTADTYIQNQINDFVLYMQPQLFYFFINFIEIRHEVSLSNKISSLYLNAFNSSIKFIDKAASKSASKINQFYTLENLIISKCDDQLNTYLKFADE